MAEQNIELVKLTSLKVLKDITPDTLFYVVKGNTSYATYGEYVKKFIQGLGLGLPTASEGDGIIFEGGEWSARKLRYSDLEGVPVVEGNTYNETVTFDQSGFVCSVNPDAVLQTYVIKGEQYQLSGTSIFSIPSLSVPTNERLDVVILKEGGSVEYRQGVEGTTGAAPGFNGNELPLTYILVSPEGVSASEIEGLFEFENGLTKSGSSVKLGGSLIEETQLDLDTYRLIFEGTSQVRFNNGSPSDNSIYLEFGMELGSDARIKDYLGSQGSTGQYLSNSSGRPYWSSLFSGNIVYDGLSNYLTVSGSTTINDMLKRHEEVLEDLVGNAPGITHLGTFTGTIIPDSSSVKSALQALETAFGSITFNNGNGTTWNSIANAYDLGGSLNQATSVLTGANALQLSINNNSGSISISDTRAITQGIVYAGDYSAGFSARSLVDRGFVETEESQLIGNVLGEDFLTFTNTAYIPDGNYTVKAALDALSAGLSPFTQGSVIFANALGELAEDNANLFYDNALNYLGVNTNTPDAPLSLVGRMSFKSPTLLNRTVKINSDGNGQDDLCIAINVISGTQTGAFNSFIANNDAVGVGPHSASNTIQIGGTRYAAYNSVGLLANSNNNSVAIGYGSGVNGSSNLGIEPSVIVGYLNTGTNINALGNSSGALIYGYNNEVTANFNAASGSTAIVLGANNQVYQNRTGSNLLQKFVIGKSITDTQETVLKDSFGVGIGSYAFLHDLTQKNWLNGGLLLTDAGYDQSSTNSSYYKIGIPPISTPTDSSALYMQDYNYANSAVAGTAAPYFRTEEGRTLSVRRAHHRDFLLEFFPSLETVRYISFDWSTAVLIKEFQFDTNQIDSLTVRFRKSSTGSASAYTGPYTISNPLNTAEIDALNSAIAGAIGSGSVELQITANFDVAWTTQAQVQIITEPNLVR